MPLLKEELGATGCNGQLTEVPLPATSSELPAAPAPETRSQPRRKGDLCPESCFSTGALSMPTLLPRGHAFPPLRFTIFSPDIHRY